VAAPPLAVCGLDGDPPFGVDAYGEVDPAFGEFGLVPFGVVPIGLVPADGDEAEKPDPGEDGEEAADGDEADALMGLHVS
jgi:hypothetical protein